MATKDYPADMDPECVALCDALNSFTGIRTIESCCGHGVENFRVHFYCETIEALGVIAQACSYLPWSMHATWATGSHTLYFTLCVPATLAVRAVKDLVIALANALAESQESHTPQTSVPGEDMAKSRTLSAKDRDA